MIKRILNKVLRKHSKILKDQESSGIQNSYNLTCSSPKRSDLASLPSNDTNLEDNGHVSISCESLPSSRDVQSRKKQFLLRKKVILCTEIFDFTDSIENVNEKEKKRQTLLELVDFVASSDVKFKRLVMRELVKMLSANLFKELAPQKRDYNILQSYELKEQQPSMDPSWPHLQIAYELLLKFIVSPQTDVNIAIRYIDHNFVLKLLDIFDSQDPRVREYLRKILYELYAKFLVHRQFIIKCINNIFYRFVLETRKHNGIAEILAVIVCVVDGFALPLHEEYKLFLSRALIPLHKPTCLTMYHEQLSRCIIRFVEKDCRLAEMVIRSLLKYWPVTNSSKEIMFLGELEDVLKLTQQPQFHRCMVPLFKQITRCLNSMHFRVAERAHLLCTNDHIKSLIIRNRKVILPIIYPALESNLRYHWNQALDSLTSNFIKFFSDLDPTLMKECLLSFQEEEAKKDNIQSRRESTWKRLEEIAADEGQ